MRVHAVALLVPISMIVGTAWLVGGCPGPNELIVVGEVNFDGGFLGPCTGDASMKISSNECPGSCLGSTATAYCVEGVYAECVCANPIQGKCDSGCCANSVTGYVPVACVGHVVIPDPSEGLCDAAVGYLQCNGTCYSTFVCDVPDGYSVMGPDGGPVDSGVDAPKDAAKDAPRDVVEDLTQDVAVDVREDVERDAAGDARDE
jgi:hypothetical protein